MRLHHYEQRPVVEEVPEPTVKGPYDVLVEIGGAGLCRTDLHIVEGQWADRSHVALPYTLGHENAGWVREVGSAVEHLGPGDTVILHPLVTCGFCRACRNGDDVHCSSSAFPGIDVEVRRNCAIPPSRGTPSARRRRERRRQTVGCRRRA